MMRISSRYREDLLDTCTFCYIMSEICENDNLYSAVTNQGPFSSKVILTRPVICKKEVPRDVRISMSENMTTSGENGLNMRTNASPEWDRTWSPEE